MSIISRQTQVVSEFEKLKTWEDKYKKLIEWGKALPDLQESLRTEESKVKGCQSQVWFHARLNSDGTVLFQGDSDAILVKGLVAVLLKIYNGSTPAEILSFKPEFLVQMGFANNLSPSRTNGLYSMIKQIIYFAQAFSLMKK